MYTPANACRMEVKVTSCEERNSFTSAPTDRGIRSTNSTRSVSCCSLRKHTHTHTKDTTTEAKREQ